MSGRADTAVSIEREVVSGHAYAILAPETADGGRCGNGKPTNLSVDGVSTRNPGPRRFRAGALVIMEVYVAQPDDMFGDDDYPAYTMGRAAEITGASQDFLRRLDEAKLWLDRALTSGRVAQGSAIVYGDLDDWPFKRGPVGRFEGIAELAASTQPLSDRETSVIARLGSGSIVASVWSTLSGSVRYRRSTPASISTTW